MNVRTKSDLSQWFKFFLVGVIETAKNSITTFDGILKLQKQVETKIQTLGSRAVNAQKLILYLYQRPVIEVQKAAEVIGSSPTTAYKLLADFEKLGILKEVTGSQRGKLYMFKDYLELFK